MSFSSFHLVKMLFDEYFTFLIERRLASDHAAELRVRIGLHEASSSSGADSSSGPSHPLPANTPGQRLANSSSTAVSLALDNVSGRSHPPEDEGAVDWLSGNKSAGSSQPLTDLSGFDADDIMAAARHMGHALHSDTLSLGTGGFDPDLHLAELAEMHGQ